MPTPRLIPFESCHVDSFDAEWKKSRGVGWTGVLAEQIIGSAGIIRLWDGVGEAWVQNWQRDRRLQLWFHRTVKEKLAEVIKSLKLWRVQAYVTEEDYQARRWIEMLGFLPAGLDFHYTHEAKNAIRYYMIVRENLPCNL